MQVKVVLSLKKDLDALKHLTEGVRPPRLQLRSMSQAVAYLMGEASILGFGSVMWSQRRLVSEAGYFTPMYHGIYLDFIEV